LTADKERCRRFGALIAQVSHVPWSANSRADVDFQTMRTMKRPAAGFSAWVLKAGPAILDNIKKGTRIEGIKAFVKDAKRPEYSFTVVSWW